MQFLAMDTNDIHAFRFDDDGETPNNARLAMVVYRDVLPPGSASDPASWFETVFAANGWGQGWRNGIHPFLHFHTGTHEVLGIASGHATVEFGGSRGRVLSLSTGDVVVLPAGVGHRRIDASSDLVVVGAYPRNGRVDQQRPGTIGHAAACAAVGKVPLPLMDPVAGRDGPLLRMWRSK